MVLSRCYPVAQNDVIGIIIAAKKELWCYPDVILLHKICNVIGIIIAAKKELWCYPDVIPLHKIMLLRLLLRQRRNCGVIQMLSRLTK